MEFLCTNCLKICDASLRKESDEYMDNEKITQPAHVAYLFMSGCHLDKRNQAYLYQIISRDKDIRKLIRSANIIAFPPILLFFVSFIFAILVGIYTSIQTAESLLSPQRNCPNDRGI